MPTIPSEIELRNTVEEFQEVLAFLDVEVVEKDEEILYFFSFELQDDPQAERLVPGKDGLICSFLDQQLKFGMPTPEDCEWQGYYSRYLRSGTAPSNFRLHVIISGEVKEKSPEDIFTGLPIVLNRIEKIESCPVEFEENSTPTTFENNFWKLVGFTDDSGSIISSPTCEDPEVGVIFNDQLLLGTPIEDPEARSFSIQSAVWMRPGPLVLVYRISGENTLSITRAVDPSYMPPRPATAITDNFPNVTNAIFNKYDSLSSIFRFEGPVEFVLSGNTLRLKNTSNGISTLLVKD
ncbi:hypothetical protein Ataiwa_09350 [Algoriphagus taiwanensis]|uniref:Uncharacterized protein n=2 Tax=Algoriphagus taiwanensis TaxID=1445656 RepID=A0ABQ6PZM5_9BACT|nr:hypothetical protein Ataiwa_09350 [Algoriphagus taiwanensis]